MLSAIICVHAVINVLLESGPHDVRELSFGTIKISGPLKTSVVNFPRKSELAKNLPGNPGMVPAADCVSWCIAHLSLALTKCLR